MSDVHSFMALGDSFTEGMHDELGADGRHRGWADRVASALATDGRGLRYANLAVRGRLLDEVVVDQVPLALDLSPDLVSFHAGANDALRPRVDLADVSRRYDEAVAMLSATGAQVVLFTVLERAGGTGWLADMLARRFAAFNAEIRRTARRHGAVLVDVGGVAALQDRRMWHGDRLHLAPRGHARVCAAVLEALGIDDEELLGGTPGWWREQLPTARVSRSAATAADARWVVQHLLPWIGRRIRGVSSGDGMSCKRPELAESDTTGSLQGTVRPTGRRWSPRGLDRFVGAIAAGAYATGDQVVVGMWRDSPLGRFVDVMWVRPDGERVLLAPSPDVRDYVRELYTFDRTEVVDIRGGWDGHRVAVWAGPLQVELLPTSRDWRSWVFALRPGLLRRSPAWLALEDRLVAPLGGPLLGGAPGVRVSGVTPSGRREWYSIDDYRWVAHGSLSVDGQRAVSELRELRSDLGVGLSAFPTRPAMVQLVTLIEPR